MIDISSKTRTLRTATAQARLLVSPATVQRLRENSIPKGNPLEVAKVAAVQAGKNTSRIIPYCHPLPIDYVGVEFDLGEKWIDVRVSVKAIHKTGVEMEALTAASVAALTLYDMMKMLDESMSIGEIALVSKTGGKSDFRASYAKPLRAGVLVISDSVSEGKKTDISGTLIVDRLKREGLFIEDYAFIPDETDKIVAQLTKYADHDQMDLVMTTGGTGFGPRDNTPEAMLQVIDREAPGIAETLRAYGQERTAYAMLSRAAAGLRGQTLIVNLAGSQHAVAESLDALFPALLHSFTMMQGGGHDS